MSRNGDRFMRPLQHLPHLAVPTKTRTPREVMLEELGLEGECLQNCMTLHKYYSSLLDDNSKNSSSSESDEGK